MSDNARLGRVLAAHALKPGIASFFLLILSGIGCAWFVSICISDPMQDAHAECDLSATIIMWIVMMAAMMIPSALPMISTYSTVSSRLQPRASTGAGLTAVFVFVYLLAWSASAAGFVEWTLAQQDVIQNSKLARPLYAGGLLIVAGLYQLSALKNFCLTRCRSPMGFMLQYYRAGVSGALQLGLRHAAFCIGCCWMLMLLAWVGGAMNVAWMPMITIFVLLEKTLPGRPLLTRAAAFVLPIAGLE
jgi:predicted metal-binding membrane protein